MPRQYEKVIAVIIALPSAMVSLLLDDNQNKSIGGLGIRSSWDEHSLGD
jgi:hypothetical protein